MSPQVQEAAPSLSASLGSAETLCDDDVPPIPLDTHKDGDSELHSIPKTNISHTIYSIMVTPFLTLLHLGPAVSVGAGGPLLLGEDELVYTVAPGGEEDIVTVLIKAHSLACRPASIVSFNSDCGSEAALALDSHLISIVSTAATEGENYPMPPGLATASGVKEVVAMAEVSGTI